MLITRYQSSFRGFHDLIKYRVREILLVSTLYDAFVLEEDRNLSERLFSEYLELDLRFVPRITRVSTARKALEHMDRKPYDLVLAMARLPDMPAHVFRREVKARHPDRALAFLTYDALDEGLLHSLRDDGAGDRAWYWSRDTNVLLSIVKQVEDHRNATRDTRAGVQVILLVEDSPRFYSMLVPALYTEIFTQTRRLISDGVNELHRLLRMRARPKVLLAETWEQAEALYREYQHNVIGIISDLRFPRGGTLEPHAGLDFARRVKAEIPDMPILLQSSEPDGQAVARTWGLGFVDKSSGTLLQEIGAFINDNFGFGDFVFRLPDGREVGRARNLEELTAQLSTIPEECLVFHARRNHFSTWLRARTEFVLAEELRPKKVSDFGSPERLRQALLESIANYTRTERAGTVQDFAPGADRYPQGFVKLGTGSLGGKARGLAFVNALLARNQIAGRYPGLTVRIPSTFVLCTDLFETFLERGRLRQRAASTEDNDQIARWFLETPLPYRVREALHSFLEGVHHPLAVRSSSLLEDNQVLPFAGIYRTYMIPNNHPDLAVRVAQLSDAIRLVWASMFFRGPQEYIRNTGYRLDEERMAVIVQQVVGRTHGDLHYPTISGVARSYNFYPHGTLKPQEGVAALALGLGKAVVDSERVWTFSPAWPRVGPPFGSTEELVENTQNRFYALDVSDPAVRVQNDETFDLRRLELARAEEDGVLHHVASTWVPADRAIRDSLGVPGVRVVRFAQILRHGTLPLPEVLQELLDAGRRSFGSPVEIEFAVDLPPGPVERADFYFLQIRPMVLNEESCEVDEAAMAEDDVLCASHTAMGNGRYGGIHDLVFVDPGTWDILRTRDMALELDTLNRQLRDEGRPYVLVGFGRWATSDPSLGIPVEWEQVSAARVFVESDREDLWVEPSQGSHFFQNMLSLRLGYMFVKSTRDGNRVAWDRLRALPVHAATPHFRHVRFDQPLRIEVDGRSSRGLIRLPDPDAP